MSNVHTWLNANKLTKTEFMLMGSGQRLNTVTASSSVTMDGTQVEQVVTTKPFGVTTDDKLSWNFHFEKLTKKTFSGIICVEARKNVGLFLDSSTVINKLLASRSPCGIFLSIVKFPSYWRCFEACFDIIYGIAQKCYLLKSFFS